MKRVFGFLLTITVMMTVLAFSQPVIAQQTQVTMELSPKDQNATVGNDVSVKVALKSSANLQVSSARVLLKFNPSFLEIKEITTSNMFCQYPTDAANYASDNTQGVIMVTGISSGTVACPYPQLTTSATDFITIVFKAKAIGTSSLDFEFVSGSLNQSSYVTDTNSPPQIVLTQPQDGSVIVEAAPIPTTTTPPSPPPDLGIETDIVIFVVVSALLVGGIYILTNKRSVESRVVIQEDN